MTEEQEMVEAILEGLRKSDNLRRKHANFWNFYKKTSKELGLFSEVFDRFKKEFDYEIIEWSLCDNDPPDVFAKLSNGQIKGVEVTGNRGRNYFFWRNKRQK